MSNYHAFGIIVLLFSISWSIIGLTEAVQSFHESFNSWREHELNMQKARLEQGRP